MVNAPPKSPSNKEREQGTGVALQQHCSPSKQQSPHSLRSQDINAQQSQNREVPSLLCSSMTILKPSKPRKTYSSPKKSKTLGNCCWSSNGSTYSVTNSNTSSPIKSTYSTPTGSKCKLPRTPTYRNKQKLSTIRPSLNQESLPPLFPKPNKQTPVEIFKNLQNFLDERKIIEAISIDSLPTCVVSSDTEDDKLEKKDEQLTEHDQSSDRGEKYWSKQTLSDWARSCVYPAGEPPENIVKEIPATRKALPNDESPEYSYYDPPSSEEDKTTKNGDSTDEEYKINQRKNPFK